MLQILYNILQKNNDKVLNSDTVAMKIVDRGLGNIILCCLMHSLYLTYFGHLLECGGSTAQFSESFINSMCWSTGVHVYGNKTKISSLYWNWDYEPVKTDFYPGIYGKSDQSLKGLVFLTQISKIPMFFMVGLALTLSGKICWTYLLGTFLHDLAAPLDSVNKDRTTKQVLTQDEKDSLLDEAVHVFIHHLRFYNELVVYYLVCLLINALGMFWQLYVIIDVVGGKDPMFGLKVLYFTSLEYLMWPMELLGMFPSVAVCTFKSVGHGGSIEPTDYLCALPWSQSYLLLFAALTVLLVVCIAITLGSLLYYTWFLICPCSARFDVKNTLKMHSKAKAFQTMSFLTPGGMFILILLSKNVQLYYIREVLARTRDEISLNVKKFNQINEGIV